MTHPTLCTLQQGETLDFLVLFHIPAGLHRPTQRPVGLLLFVLHLDLGKVQRDLIRRDHHCVPTPPSDMRTP